MHAYVLVSCKDPPESEWCSLDGALAHLCAVESYSRLESKATNSMHSTLVEAESSIRHEWHRILQLDQTLTLNDAIEVASKSSIWPLRQNFWKRNNADTPFSLRISVKGLNLPIVRFWLFL